MSPIVRQRVFAVVGLLLLVAIIYGTIVVLREAWRFLSSMNSDISVAIIASAVTVLFSVLSIVVGKAYESRALVKREHREKKIPVCEDLIKFTFRIFMSAKTGDAPSGKEMAEFMSAFNQRIMVWGSDDVLAAWVEWRRAAIRQANGKGDSTNLMLLYGQLILTIRRDLGHKNENLGSRDVLALFVNDIDQVSKPKVG